MTTYNKITEQIQRLYARFLRREDTKGVIEERELKELVAQSINKILNLEIMSSFTEGDLTIPDCMIASYSAIAVTSTNGVAKATLPAIPIGLPRNMGVWVVVDTDDPGNEFIPMTSQEYRTTKNTHTAFLESHAGYFVTGKTITFTEDITSTLNVSTVDIELLVNDPSQLTDTELLPINADMEQLVIIDVLEVISKGRFSMEELNKPEEQTEK